jgi:hypothetical protein
MGLRKQKVKLREWIINASFSLKNSNNKWKEREIHSPNTKGYIYLPTAKKKNFHQMQ